jgi:hypothetical protein
MKSYEASLAVVNYCPDNIFRKSTTKQIIVPKTLTLKSVVEDYYPTANMQPPYQRGWMWPEEKISKFLETVYERSGLVQEIILYSYQENEITNKYEYETVDGQHRMTSLFAFRTGSPIIGKNNKSIRAYMKIGVRYIFYEPIPAIEQWQQDTGNTVAYLDVNQRKEFDRFELRFQIIQSPLMPDERRQWFDRLQEGVPVRNSDKLKNIVDGKIISELNSIDNWESKYRSKYMSRLTSCREQNRLFCMVRLYRVFHAIKTGKDIGFVMESDDTQIKKMLLLGSIPELNMAAEFGKAMDIVYDALDELEPKGKHYTPIQLFALAVEIFKTPDPETVNQLVTRCQTQVKQKSEKKIVNCDVKENKARKSLWFDALYKDKKDEYTKYYKDSCDFLRSDAVISKPVPKARKVSKNVTPKKVWAKFFGTDEHGSCFCCDKPLKFCDYGNQWAKGHNVAHAVGGSDTDIGNFVVECNECNNAHKKMSADEYRRRIWNK